MSASLPHTDQHQLSTPIGVLTLSASADRLVGLEIESTPLSTRPLRTSNLRILQEAAAQLGEYFAGERTSFDLPLALSGTEFQNRVWDALTEIPFGDTVSYQEVAQRIGAPRAARAVGRAVGANPIPIIVPCHRVLGASGVLTGYSGGGGIDTKRSLLKREAAGSSH